MKIFTIGYGNKDLNKFLEILKANGISRLLDIRALPTSKRREFAKENLAFKLVEASIKYVHFEDLGGFRSSSFEEYSKTKKFENAIRRTMQLSKSETTVLMCLEPNPRGCHRRYVAKALKSRGAEVVHLA